MDGEKATVVVVAPEVVVVAPEVVEAAPAAVGAGAVGGADDPGVATVVVMEASVVTVEAGLTVPVLDCVATTTPMTIRTAKAPAGTATLAHPDPRFRWAKWAPRPGPADPAGSWLLEFASLISQRLLPGCPPPDDGLPVDPSPGNRTCDSPSRLERGGHGRVRGSFPPMELPRPWPVPIRSTSAGAPEAPEV